MKKAIIWIAIAMGMILAAPAVSAMPSIAGSLVGESCDENSQTTGVCASDESKNQTVDSTLKNIIDFLLMVAGLLAVVMIIVSGIKIMTSAGDSNKFAAGKKTLLYAVIGLAVSVSAFAIVNLVVAEVNKPRSSVNGSPPASAGNNNGKDKQQIK